MMLRERKPAKIKIGGIVDKADFKVNFSEYCLITGKYKSKKCDRGCIYCKAIEIQTRTNRDMMVGESKSVSLQKRYKVRCSTTSRSDARSVEWLEKKLCPHHIVQFFSAGDIVLDMVPIAADTILRVLERGATVVLHSKMGVDVAIALMKRLIHYAGSPKLIFQLTYTTYDAELMKQIERRAPELLDRQLAIRILAQAGFVVNISCTPALSPDVEKIYNSLKPFITGTFYIGSIQNNYPRRTFCTIYGKDMDKRSSKVLRGKTNLLKKWLNEYNEVFNREWALRMIEFSRRHSNVVCERTIFQLAGVIDGFRKPMDHTKEVVVRSTSKVKIEN